MVKHFLPPNHSSTQLWYYQWWFFYCVDILLVIRCMFLLAHSIFFLSSRIGWNRLEIHTISNFPEIIIVIFAFIRSGFDAMMVWWPTKACMRLRMCVCVCVYLHPFLLTNFSQDSNRRFLSLFSQTSNYTTFLERKCFNLID